MTRSIAIPNRHRIHIRVSMTRAIDHKGSSHLRHSMHSIGAGSCPSNPPGDIYPRLTLPVNGD
jgi:hypothetical protein